MPPTAPPPIDKVDPARAWQPWEPGARDPFNLKWAGHLFRRAGFSANLSEMRAAVEKGLEATLTRLLDGEEGAEAREQLLLTVGDKMVSDDKPEGLRGWWCYCMIHTAHPLREKMTVFWHNHFATSIAKVVRPTLMYAQNKLLRRHALGKFRPFLLEVSRDPAMIVWLDNNANVKGQPNENYAREIMELFSLGVGNYTEQDIKEAARAFTGWHTSDSGDAYEFNAREHDDGPKTVLGQSGKWNGDDVVRILLDQPQAARFLVRKLYRYFISEPHEPPAALLEPLAESFRKNDYDVAALMKTMLRSRHFFSDYAYRQRLKSPVEFVLGAARAVVHPTEDQETVRLPPGPLVNRMAAMGQELFTPPNVKGWPHGKAWLNTSTVLARNNFAQHVAFGRIAEEVYDDGSFNTSVPVPPPPGTPAPPPPEVPEGPAPPAVYDPADLVRQAKLTEPAKVVDFLLDLFLQGDAPAPARTKLVAFVAQGKPKDKSLDRRVREAAHTIMCMPEYQLA
ncbi:MAG TPA: DUF1800 domain-containing protein [Gemmataceae bacterium]|nr:DUF1800 domain-containing protein [Gemmataceae bacterium]